MALPGHLAPACRLYLKRTDTQRLLAARLGRGSAGNKLTRELEWCPGIRIALSPHISNAGL